MENDTAKNANTLETLDTLRLQLANAERKLAEVEAALVAFMNATSTDTDGGMTEMRSLDGRTAFYERIDKVKAQAYAALAPDRTAAPSGGQPRTRTHSQECPAGEHLAAAAPIQAESKSQYKRLVTQGADVMPPATAPTKENEP